MSQKASRVSTDIDYEKDGKQSGFLRVPHSRNESAWGTLMVPITVVKNGSGPTVLFTGANHGDEYEGPVAEMKLARQLTADQVSGRIIIMHALNLPALRAGTRLSPIDSKNMNRIFPGDRNGTITEVIAHYVHSELLPLSDAVVDLHSGGKSMTLMPCAVIHQLPDPAQMTKTLAALEAFGAPLGLVLEELDAEGMLDTAAEETGKVFVSSELGGGGTISVETQAIADIGVRNLLKHFGVIEGEPVSRSSLGLAPTRLMQVPDGRHFVAARASGIYEPFVEIGDEVTDSQAIGQIHFFEEPERPPMVLEAGRGGTVIARWIPGHVTSGDCVAVTAVGYTPS